MRWSLSKRLKKPANSYRSSVPPPAAILPKTPLLFSSFIVRFMVLFCPSLASPANASASVLVSVTCTFSIISFVRFRVVIVGSSPKKGFPFTKILFTGLPFTVICPSSSTSTPGSFLSKSSTLASFFVLNDFTLNSRVSFLMVMGALDFITTSSRRLELVFICMIPRSISSEVKVISF